MFGRGPAGPCGQRQDHAGRRAVVPRGRAAQAGPGGPPRRLFGHRRAGARAGHHDFCQAGRAGAAGGRRSRGDRADAAGHAGACGFFGRGRARLAGAGLRGAGGQRHRRRAGPHRDAVEAAGALPRADVCVCEQDGPAGGRRRRAPAGAARPFWRRLHRFYRRARRRSAGAVQRTADGGSAGHRRAARRHAGAGHCAAAGVPLLFWRGAAPAGPGRAAARAADADAHAAHLAGVWRAGVQNQPGRRRRAADLAEGDRRHAAGKSRAARRRESRRAAAVQRQQVPAGERGRTRHGGGGGRPGPHAPRPGPGGRG